MKFRALQWNIQAARTLDSGKDPKESASYSGDDPEYFAEVINKYNPDVVALQELHKNIDRNQLAEIAKLTGLKYHVYDEYEKESFLNPKYGMGQGILSKYELLNHRCQKIEYPKFTDKDEAGIVYYSRDFGVTTAEVDIEGVVLTLATAHSPSFGTYGLTEDDVAAKPLHASYDSLLATLGGKWVFIGDLNIKSQSLKVFFPKTLAQYDVGEIVHTTTVPKGFVLDHVIYRNLELVDAKVDSSVRADHYLLISDFKI